MVKRAVLHKTFFGINRVKENRQEEKQYGNYRKCEGVL